MKTRCSRAEDPYRCAALALLFGVAAAFAASPVLAQEARPMRRSPKRSRRWKTPPPGAEAAVAEAPAMEAAAEEAADGTEAEGPAFDSGNVA